MDFQALHRASLAYVHYVPTIPGIDMPAPPRPQGDGRAIVAGTMAPIRDLDHDEMTRLLAELRRQSATREGHRDYGIAFLAASTGISIGDLADLAPGDVRLDLSPPILCVPGRTVTLDSPDLTDLLRRWEVVPTGSTRSITFPVTHSRDG